jgi:hypothetical protein
LDSSTPQKSPAGSRVEALNGDGIPLKAVHFTGLMRIPGFTNAANRVVHVSQRDPDTLNFQGSNCIYAELLYLNRDIIYVNDFAMPLTGGGILGYIRE